MGGGGRGGGGGGGVRRGVVGRKKKGERGMGGEKMCVGGVYRRNCV